MAKNKVYAVRKGRKTGIYDSWDECKVQVEGYSEAEFKSFSSRQEAKEYIEGIDKKEKVNRFVENSSYAEAYVDGSYNSKTNEFSFGMVIFYDGEIIKHSEKFDDKEFANMHNVAGEIKGAEAAIRFAVENKLTSITIYHDYEGIAKWCSGEWKANKEGTKAYKRYYDSVKDKIAISFVKVTSHSNNLYNDMADELAKQALGLVGEKQSSGIHKENENLEISPTTSFYITRDLEKLTQLLDDTVKSIWSGATGKGIDKIGQQQRYTFEVNGKISSLDIYQRSDGQTTLKTIEVDDAYAIKLKDAIESRGYKTTSAQKQFTMFVGEDWIKKTVRYLSDLCNGHVEKHENQEHIRYVFVSEIGDKLTLHTYSNHKILVQGKPLYLYNEFLSYVSYSPKVEMNDIVSATNAFVDTNTDVDEARTRMSEMMPVAYAGKVDPVIWKLFSPSVTLIGVEKKLEDYSCFTFPALRALEAYLKYLFSEKDIVIDETNNFGSAFTKNADGKMVVIHKYAADIADADYVEALEEVYNYFRANRHVIFHVNQILIATKVIESKQEATSIINEVAALIESTYKKITK